MDRVALISEVSQTECLDRIAEMISASQHRQEPCRCGYLDEPCHPGARYARWAALGAG